MKVKTNAAKAKGKVKLAAEVPHPSELPLWGIILAIALIAAVALFFLSGGSLTGRYHVPGGSDTIRLGNITITSTNLNITLPPGSSCPNPGYYYGSGFVSAFRITLGSGLVFKFQNNVTSQAFVVVRNLTVAYPKPGTILFYNNKNSRWECNTTGYGYAFAALPVFANAYAPWNYTQIVLYSTSGVVSPASFTGYIYDRNVYTPYDPNYRINPAGTWRFSWSDTRRLPFTFGGMNYSHAGETFPVFPGYVSPTESVYYPPQLAGQVIIGYAYNVTAHP